ncbi:MAG: 2-oxoacid:acceptor oxidoreductase subunit alpha [Acidobacteriota bacterium]
MRSDLIIGIAGAGGDGVVSAGEALITAAALEGYYAMLTKSFGSQIRGGECSCRLRIATQAVLNPGGTLDVAVALNWQDFSKFGAELPVGRHTVVIYDSKAGVAPDSIPLDGVKPAEVLAVPIGEMAKQAAGTDRAKNVLVLGLLAGWLGIPRQRILASIRQQFVKQMPEVMAGNERAFAAGIAYTEAHPWENGSPLAAAAAGTTPLLTDGNHMCAAAAIYAGCQFFSGYPITPSSEIMQFLNREIWKYGGTLLQAEDEMAGVGAAVGASFAGKKAMTATSGPGMSLKAEILGLASMAELPLVCVNVQRGGPSTGLPTKSEQADLFQAIFSAHGDVVRPVLAPVSVADTFGITVEAFNIAEQYQTPVIVLSDQAIAQRKETVQRIDTGAMQLLDRRRPTATELDHYARFRLTESGISPLTRPGVEGGTYLASGIEHNEHGAPTGSGTEHARMNAKRLKKLHPLKRRYDLFVLEGDQGAPVGLISWGSMAGVALEALRWAQAEGLRVKLLVPKLLYPVSEEIYQHFFASVETGLVVEQSHQGQLHKVIRMYVDVPAGVESLAKSSSNPITADEVVKRLRELASARERGRRKGAA